MRILALVPGGVGDQVLFFPTLADLKERYPEAMIDVLVEPRAKAAYRVCTHVHEVLTFDFKDRNGPADYLNILGTIRDREYEIALSLGTDWVIGLLLWLNGIPTRIGYKTSSSLFLSQTVPQNNNQYAAQRYHELLTSLDITTPCGTPQITVPSSDIQWAEGEQKRLGLTDGYILIHGGSNQYSIAKGIEERYPLEKWRAIIQDIQAKQPSLPIVMLQGLEDYEWVSALKTQVPELKVTAPEDMGKTAAMVAGANLFVCTDSAQMQLAVAVGTYTVALFGSTKAASQLPPDNDKVIGIQSPSGKLAEIKPEEVLAQIWRG